MNFLEWLDFEEAFLTTEAKIPNPPWRTTDPFLGKNPKTSKSDVVVGEEKTKAGIDAKNLQNSLKRPDGGQYDDFDSYLIHFMPAAQSGFITCPCASGGCASECLNTAGNMGSLGGKSVSRLKRTWQMAKEAPFVLNRIKREIAGKYRKAQANNHKLVIRLNGTSDFDWTKYKDENGKSLFQIFPDVQFYDYTKVGDRVDKLPKENPNYHITFSRSEKPENQEQAKKLLDAGHNVAVVFGPGKTGGASELIFKPKVNPNTVEILKAQGIIPKDYIYTGKKAGETLLPTTFEGFHVVDGDGHDLRFLEKKNKGKGVVIGLTAKGSSAFENFDLKDKQFKADRSGFVVQPLDPNITRYPENYDFIVQAMDFVFDRNKKQSNGKRDYAMSKLLYGKKQAVITYAIFDDIEPLVKIAEDWAKLQNPPVILKTRAEKEAYAKKLAEEEMPSVSYKSPISLRSELDRIADYCAKYPEKCDKLYLNPLTKAFDTAAGGKEYVDVTGYKKPTFQLKMADEPKKKLSPGLAALLRGKQT